MEIKVFDNPIFDQVRVIDINGEVWFVGSEIAKNLGYSNSRKALADHCREGGVTKRYIPTESGDQLMTLINEPNLYRLVIKSKLKAAKKFEEWVMNEVLPTIRKTGSYTPETTPATPVQALLQTVQLLADHEDRITLLEKQVHYKSEDQRLLEIENARMWQKEDQNDLYGKK